MVRFDDLDALSPYKRRTMRIGSRWPVRRQAQGAQQGMPLWLDARFFPHLTLVPVGGRQFVHQAGKGWPLPIEVDHQMHPALLIIQREDEVKLEGVLRWALIQPEQVDKGGRELLAQGTHRL